MQINKYNKQFYFHLFDNDTQSLEEFLNYFNKSSSVHHNHIDDTVRINYTLFDEVIQIHNEEYLIVVPYIDETSLHIKYNYHILTEKEFNILTFQKYCLDNDNLDDIPF